MEEIATNITLQHPYAYVTTDGTHLWTFDISDPERPAVVSKVTAPGVTWEMAIAGRYACLSAFGEGMHVLDLADPAHPVVVGSVWTPSSVGVATIGDYAMLADFHSRRVFVVSIRDPENPEVVADLPTPGSAWDVAVKGKIAVVTAQEGGLITVDVSDPLDPRRLARLDIPRVSYDVAIAGDIAIVAAEYGIHLVDIADPAHPAIVATVPTNWTCWTVSVRDRYAFVGCAEDGLRVIDIENPANPVEVAHVPVPGVGSWAWGVATHGDLLYAIERYSGLQIFEARIPVGVRPLATVPTPGEVSFDVSVEHNVAYVADARGGLAVVDVTDPAAPNVIASVPIQGLASGVLVSSARVYLVGDFGLKIFDVTDPGAPALLGTAGGLSYGVEIALKDGFAYVADHQLGLCVFDVRDPAHPVRVGRLDPGGGYAWGVYVTGHIACLTDTVSGLFLIDVTDPAHPVLLASVPFDFLAQAVVGTGNLLFVGGKPRDVVSIDISDPQNPAAIAHRTTMQEIGDLKLQGGLLWMAEPYGVVQIVDASSPQTMPVVGLSIGPGDNYGLEVAGRHAYTVSTGLNVLPGYCRVTPVAGPPSARSGRGATLLLNGGAVDLGIERVGDTDGARGRLAILDASGRTVRALAAREGCDGRVWDGKDEMGRRVPSGVYFAREPGREAVRRILVVR